MSREIDIAERAEQINSAFKAEQTEYRKLCKLCAEAEALSRDEKEALYNLQNAALQTPVKVRVS